jgi:uncharacterized membrane protein YwzB
MSAMLKTVVALLCIAAVWWSMAELALASDVIQAGVRDVILRSPFQKSGVVEFVDFHEQYCCEDFNTGFAWSFFVTAFSAIPMGLLALVLSWRRHSLSRSVALQAIARAALILQGASTVLNLLLTLMWFSDDPVDLVNPWGWIVAAGMVASLVAIPVWYRLSQAQPA